MRQTWHIPFSVYITARAYSGNAVRVDLQSTRMNIGIYNPATPFIAFLRSCKTGAQAARPEVKCLYSMLSDCKSDRTLLEEPRAYFGRASRLFRRRVCRKGESQGVCPGFPVVVVCLTPIQWREKRCILTDSQTLVLSLFSVSGRIWWSYFSFCYILTINHLWAVYSL